MNYMGIPEIEDIHKEEQESLKSWCEKQGWNCETNCGSATASGWCKYHPNYVENGKGPIIH